jgi:2-keto-4-pentenoate hydratase/2-oxohepta-3-ene-1,7-dioic acid hydratase in catechol pathway
MSVTFARLGLPGHEIPVLRAHGRTYDLRALTEDIDGAFLGSDGLVRAEDAWERGQLPELEDVEGLRVAAPIARPGKVVCVGLNYRDHAEETGAALPDEPVMFLKDPDTVVGPFDTVLVPRGSVKTDYEVELGVVIGRVGRYLTNEGEAAGCIVGYTVSHDVSEREFQLERGGQWDKGKSCETFNPLGPSLVPASAVPDPQALPLRLSVNGEQRQKGSTADMIFGVHHLVWYLSQFLVLRPGDLINTGTPAGVALGRPGEPYLRAGDVVELEVGGLGVARQKVAQA